MYMQVYIPWVSGCGSYRKGGVGELRGDLHGSRSRDFIGLLVVVRLGHLTRVRMTQLDQDTWYQEETTCTVHVH